MTNSSFFVIKSTSMNLDNVLVRFNKLLWYCCSFSRIQYRGHHSPLHLPSQKKNSGFQNTFFRFICVVVKNKIFEVFPLIPVTTTIIWPTTDRIPHSLIFKNMQNKRIADNIHAFSCLLANWNKEPDEERICHWTILFTS